MKAGVFSVFNLYKVCAVVKFNSRETLNCILQDLHLQTSKAPLSKPSHTGKEKNAHKKRDIDYKADVAICG